jgi:hypothetical protein
MKPHRIPPPANPTHPFRISHAGFGWFLLFLLLALLALFRNDFIRSIRTPELVLSEIMSVDHSTLADADGDFPGWIEIHNPLAQTQNLGGWHLTDSFRRPTKWTFPDRPIPPGGFVVVFTSGKDRVDPTGELHTNFRLSRKGEYLALVRPDGQTVVDEYLPKYPPMDPDVSFGLRPRFFSPGEFAGVNRSLRKHAFFTATTPGHPNHTEMTGHVGPVRPSHRRGLHRDPFLLALSTGTSDATIWFTTNGSIPTPGSGFRYSVPIPIRTTTTLRLAAFKPGFRSTPPATFTYLFPDHVSQQTGAGWPTNWGIRNDTPVVADYEIDPDIAASPSYRNRFSPALTSLPSLSLVVDPADLFDPDRGIYAHPMESGAAWERPASLELLPHADHQGFLVSCGVRIQGGWSRRPEESPKHSFRIEFRPRYGNPLLKQPFFGTKDPDQVQTLILRAGCNNSWLHWNSTERRQGDLLRDPFMRDSFRATGQASSRGRFFHLYLNGLYWGIYNASERPDESFLSQHLGGSPANYESRNASTLLAGSDAAWKQLFAVANAGVEETGSYAEISSLLDIDNFCAFMLVQIFGGTSDWDAASNWYAGRRIQPPGRFQFLIWDSERSLETISANILDADDDQSPTRLFQVLRRNPTFRSTFSRIAHRHLDAGGALSPEASARRYARLAEELRPAMVAESARWGDYRRDIHPYREGPYELYTVDDHWEPEVNRLLQHYFPARTQEVIRQLTDAGLY